MADAHAAAPTGGTPAPASGSSAPSVTGPYAEVINFLKGLFGDSFAAVLFNGAWIAMAALLLLHPNLQPWTFRAGSAINAYRLDAQAYIEKGWTIRLPLYLKGKLASAQVWLWVSFFGSVIGAWALDGNVQGKPVLMLLVAFFLSSGALWAAQTSVDRANGLPTDEEIDAAPSVEDIRDRFPQLDPVAALKALLVVPWLAALCLVAFASTLNPTNATTLSFSNLVFGAKLIVCAFALALAWQGFGNVALIGDAGGKILALVTTGAVEAGNLVANTILAIALPGTTTQNIGALVHGIIPSPRTISAFLQFAWVPFAMVPLAVLVCLGTNSIGMFTVVFTGIVVIFLCGAVEYMLRGVGGALFAMVGAVLFAGMLAYHSGYFQVIFHLSTLRAWYYGGAVLVELVIAGALIGVAWWFGGLFGNRLPATPAHGTLTPAPRYNAGNVLVATITTVVAMLFTPVVAKWPYQIAHPDAAELYAEQRLEQARRHVIMTEAETQALALEHDADVRRNPPPAVATTAPPPVQPPGRTASGGHGHRHHRSNAVASRSNSCERLLPATRALLPADHRCHL